MTSTEFLKSLSAEQVDAFKVLRDEIMASNQVAMGQLSGEHAAKASALQSQLDECAAAQTTSTADALAAVVKADTERADAINTRDAALSTIATAKELFLAGNLEAIHGLIAESAKTEAQKRGEEIDAQIAGLQAERATLNVSAEPAIKVKG